jgi:hypothetical protein
MEVDKFTVPLRPLKLVTVMVDAPGVLGARATTGGLA